MRAWPTMRAPLMPYGWPIEIAPPFTLSLSFGIRSSGALPSRAVQENGSTNMPRRSTSE